MISPLNWRGWGRVSEGMMAAEDIVMARVVCNGESKVSRRDGHPYIRFSRHERHGERLFTGEIVASRSERRGDHGHGLGRAHTAPN